MPGQHELDVLEYQRLGGGEGAAYKGIEDMPVIQVDAGFCVVQRSLRATIEAAPQSLTFERTGGMPLQVERVGKKLGECHPVFSEPLGALALRAAKPGLYAVELLPSSAHREATTPIEISDWEGFEKFVDTIAVALRSIQQPEPIGR